MNLYRLGLEKNGRNSGTPVRFVSTTRNESSAQFSPDDSRVAFVSNRSGHQEIWLCAADGTNLAQLTNFAGSAVTGLSWSPNGSTLAFSLVGNADVALHLISAGGGSPRRLTTPALTPSWSQDGKWVYFMSNQSGRTEVWKIAAEGGTPLQLTHGGGMAPIESAGGQSVYYLHQSDPVGVWSVPRDGGQEALVVRTTIAPGNWAVRPGGLYLLEPAEGESSYTLQFFDTKSGARRQLAAIALPPSSQMSEDARRSVFLITSITMSPDERTIIYTQRDQLEVDLMLVENLQ